MQSIDKTILSRIHGHGRGWVFTPKHFADIADPNVVSAILSRLQKKAAIRRVSHGIYDYPKTHPRLGDLSPSVESIIKALRVKEGIKFQPTGAYAANLLNLSEQVPAKVIFFTNGKSRKIRIGNRTIELKNRSARNMHLAGTTGGLIVEAFRYLGEKHITETHIKRLTKGLPEKEKQRLKKHLRYIPIWMRPFILRIINA